MHAMISFRDYKPDPRFALDPTPIQNAIRARTEFVEQTYRNAILTHLGYWPDDETIKRHAHEFVTPDGTRHLAWLETKPAIGEKADLTKTIATIQPIYRNTP
jgi:hypothetical protein